MTSTDLSVLVPLTDLQSLLSSAGRVPSLESRLAELSDSVAALRGLYLECLDTLSAIKRDL